MASPLGLSYPPGGRGSRGPATGPYRFGSVTPEGHVVLEAFPAYRDGRAPIASVEFRIDPGRPGEGPGLLHGEADLIEDIVPDDMPALRAGTRPADARAAWIHDGLPGHGPGADGLPAPIGRRARSSTRGCARRWTWRSTGRRWSPGRCWLRGHDGPARSAGSGGLRELARGRRSPTPLAPARSSGRLATPTASASRSTSCRERWTAWSRCWAASWRRWASASSPGPTTRPGFSRGSSAATRRCTSCGGSSRARRSRKRTPGCSTRPGASSAR